MTIKTLKIGEYAVGGVIRTEIDDNANIKISCLDWNTRKVVLSKKFHFVDKSKIAIWLEDEVTTCYYAEKIMKLIYV